MSTIHVSMPTGSGDTMSFSISSRKISADSLEKYANTSFVNEILTKRTSSIVYRFYVLNVDETIRYEIPQEDILTGGSFNENYQSGSRRSLSFSLYNGDGKYNPSPTNLWVGTKIKFQSGFYVERDGIEIMFDQGVFVIKSINPSRSSRERNVSVSCGDKFEILEGKNGTIGEAMEIQYGERIVDIINDILKSDKGNGEFIDYISPKIDPSFADAIVQQKIAMSSGSTIGRLLLDIGEMISAEIFYDSTGALVVTPIVETMNDGSKQVLYHYTDDYVQNDSMSFDYSSFVNCVYVIGANVNGHTCIAVAKNDDPSSPISVNRIGLRTGNIVNDTNITSDILAMERAEYELRRSAILQTSVNAGVFFNPYLTVNNIVTLTSKDNYDMIRERYLIQSLSYNLDFSGSESITVSNINNIPFVA